MTNPKVFIIILQYNNSDDTIRCLESVKELDYQNYRIIVVDNLSETKHLNSVRFFIENQRKLSSTLNYKLLPANSNLGYSGGNNIGIRYAIQGGADYVLILNPDTNVEKSFLTKLVEAGESDQQIGILGPAMDEGTKVVYGGKIEWLKPELSHSIKSKAFDFKHYVAGAAMLIKKEVIETIGLPDERYFLYFEDADYCIRAQKAGFELKIAPKALIYHRASSSTSTLGSARLLHYHYRNSHLFNFKNGPLWVKITLPFWSILIIIKQLLKLLMGRERQISKAILAGVIDFYRGRFGKIS